MRQKPVPKTALALLLACALVLCAQPLWAQDSPEVLDKVVLQSRTQEILEDLDHLTSQLHTVTGKRSALFSDQSEENLCGYKSVYESVDGLLERLETIAEQWKALSDRNPKDKIYRAYLATTYLAMYSIYSRGDDFLTFLKIAQDYQGRYACLGNDLPVWSDKKYDWSHNAEKMLLRAQECVATALSVDPDYRDGLIVKVELLAMQDKIDDAVTLLEKLQGEGWFRDREAFYYSWKAYLDSRKGRDPQEVEPSLRSAAASTKPFQNSNWASSFSRALRTVDFSGVMLTAYGYEGSGVALPLLEQWTMDAVARAGYEISRPLRDIPMPLPAEFDPEAYAQYGDFFLTLATDTSDGNLGKYARMIQNIYGAVAGYDYSDRGRKSNPGLLALMTEWDKLAKKNPQASFYYLMRKVQCGMEIRNVVGLTLPLLENKSLVSYLDRAQGHLKDSDRVKYLDKWREWNGSIGYTMDADIRQMKPKGISFPAADYTGFECTAVAGEPVKAMMELENMAAAYDKSDVKIGIPVLQSSGDPLSGAEYFRAWRTYLAFKMGDIAGVRRIVNEVGAFPNLGMWAKDQNKVLELEGREKK